MSVDRSKAAVCDACRDACMRPSGRPTGARQHLVDLLLHSLKRGSSFGAHPFDGFLHDFAACLFVADLGEDVDGFDNTSVGPVNLIGDPLDRLAKAFNLDVVPMLAAVVANGVECTSMDGVDRIVEGLKPHHAPRKLPPPTQQTFLCRSFVRA
eukprot:3340574-Prymnesium_polylepis.2